MTGTRPGSGEGSTDDTQHIRTTRSRPRRAASGILTPVKNRPRVLMRVGPVECSECGHVARSHEEAIAQGWVRYRKSRCGTAGSAGTLSSPNPLAPCHPLKPSQEPPRAPYSRSTGNTATTPQEYAPNAPEPLIQPPQGIHAHVAQSAAPQDPGPVAQRPRAQPQGALVEPHATHALHRGTWRECAPG